MSHYWIVDPEAQQLECYRATEGQFELVVQAEKSATLIHPDWPDLPLPLAILWA